MDKIRDRFMHLSVKLTEEEIANKQDELVSWTRVRSENEHQLEAWLSDMKEERKQKEAQILAAAGYANRAADVIEAGEERRDVEVSDHFDGGNIVTIRNDTGEVVATRPAGDDERQMLLKIQESPTETPEVTEECVCESEEIASIDCPIHGPEGRTSKYEEEEGDDGSPSDDL
jgi:hypothetical protein